MISFFKKCINKFLFIFGYKLLNLENEEVNLISKEDVSIINLYAQYSMTSDLRRAALLKSFNYIKDNKIDGDFVECGVWQGGNIMSLSHLNTAHKTNKKTYGYDTFMGMSKPTTHDIKAQDGTIAINKFNKFKDNDEFSNWDKCTIEKVVENFTKHNLDMTSLKLIKGKVEDTLLDKNNLPREISLLRLDTDFYESTKIELEILYPLLSKNGVLIIDDYGTWQGAKKAVDEYFKDEKVWLHFVDRDCRLMIK
tara:strand:- start:8 stop:763 length:756 start_codon:yes stop_codon:yes gene_type:complete